MRHLILSLSYLCFVFCLSACTPSVGREFSNHQEAALEARLVSLLSEATESFRRGDAESLGSAGDALVLAYELKPSDPRVVDGLGCLAWRTGDVKLAKRYFQQAISLNSNYDRGYAHLAMVAEHEGDFLAARDLLKLALHLNPLNSRARNNLAAMMIDEGNAAEAYSQLSRAYLSANASDPVLSYNLNQIE